MTAYEKAMLAVHTRQRVGAGLEAEMVYYHVAPQDYCDGTPLVSLQRRLRDGDISLADAESRWPDYDCYLASYDADNVSLFASLDEAETFAAFEGGIILRVVLPSDVAAEIRHNSEGYPSISDVPAEFIARARRQS